MWWPFTKKVWGSLVVLTSCPVGVGLSPSWAEIMSDRRWSVERRGEEKRAEREAKLGDHEAPGRRSWRKPEAPLCFLPLCPINVEGAEYIQWPVIGAG